MEKNTKQLKEHNIILKNREEISLSGVNEVVSFTATQIILKTVCGGLLIRGNSLNIGLLNTDTGELSITGTVSYMKYNKSKGNGGVFEGIFK